jgi:hypothetical protein
LANIPAIIRSIPERRRPRGLTVPGEELMVHEFNVLALVKGPERFVFVYDDASHPGLVDVLQELAANPASNLTWFDAHVLTKKAREQASEENAFVDAGDEWSFES